MVYFQVVDKLTVWNGKYAAINSFGIGGTNSHLVLKRNEIEKSPNKKTEIPRIMAVSGRTESAVQNLLKQVYCNNRKNYHFNMNNNAI